MSLDFSIFIEFQVLNHIHMLVRVIRMQKQIATKRDLLAVFIFPFH